MFKAGLGFLKQGNIGAAIEFLRLSEKFSGMDNFDFIQYGLATCYYFSNNVEEADRYIYRALVINPDCKEYQNLKVRIDNKVVQASKVLV